MNEIHTYIGRCCREWILATGFHVGRCGLCGERPTYERPDPDSPHPIKPARTEWTFIAINDGEGDS